ncbi:MAG: amidohydrolase family protein [Kiritimatiellae bacterium]|nr:amidohydrolase family protein [Kiritimatiellia bacterium]
MEITRRDFVKTGSGAAAAGVAGCVTALQDVEKTIADVKFIDIHAHCTEDPMPPCYLLDKRPLPVPEDLIRHYDRIGIEKGVILALCNPENFVGGMSTEQILRTCATHPDRFIPSVAVDPRAMGNRTFNSKFGDVFKYYRDKGCKVCGEVCANLHFLDPRMQNLFKGCEEAGLPLTFHIAANKDWLYGIIDEKGLPELEICLQRFPKLNFLGHSQSFWCEIGEYSTWDERTSYPKGPVKEGRIPQLMRKYPNLYGDLSAGSGNIALSRDLDYAGRFLTEFQDRILFGVDICAPDAYVSPLDKTMKELLRTGRISASVYRKVARDNHIRLLGL